MHSDIKKFWLSRGGKLFPIDDIYLNIKVYYYVQSDNIRGEGIIVYVKEESKFPVYTFEDYNEKYTEEQALKLIKLQAFL